MAVRHEERIKTKVASSEVKNKKPRRGPHQVQVDRRLLAYLPWSCAQKRTGCWSMTKALPSGGSVTAKAPETITSTDIVTFLGFLKLCQDSPELVHTSTIDYGLGEEVKDLLVAIALPEWQMCLRVAGDHNLKDFRSSVERLAGYTITWHFPDGDQIMTRLIWASRFQEGMGSIVVSANMLDFMASDGWLVYLDRVKKLRGNISRALALYLSQQHSPIIRQETIMNVLWGTTPPDPVTCRKLILKAGAELVDAKVVSSFTAQKTNTGWVFKISKSKDNPPTTPTIPTRNRSRVASFKPHKV